MKLKVSAQQRKGMQRQQQNERKFFLAVQLIENYYLGYTKSTESLQVIPSFWKRRDLHLRCLAIDFSWNKLGCANNEHAQWGMVMVPYYGVCFEFD